MSIRSIALLIPALLAQGAWAQEQPLPETAPVPTPVAETSPIGTIYINGCSGSLVAFEGQDTKRFWGAYVLTNGHCVNRGSLGTEEFHYPALNEAFLKVDARNDKVYMLLEGGYGGLRPHELAYATMTDTDMALFRIRESYDEIEAAVGIKPFVIAKDPVLTPGTKVEAPSGRWKDVQSCQIDAQIPGLKEGDWEWRNSLRLTSECQLRHGASGSPLLLKGTRTLIGVVNTMYEGGEPCTFDNPCEIDAEGRKSVGPALQPYGQLVNGLYNCLNEAFEVDLTRRGCSLPVPKEPVAQ